MKSLIVWMLAVNLVPVYCLGQEPAPESAPEEPLVIQDVRCQGNTSTSCQFISSHLYLASGDKLNEREIRNAKLRLSTLLNLKTVDVHLEKGTEKGLAVIVIEVTESSPITTEIAVGTTLSAPSLSQKIAGRVSHHNLFGTGKILDLEVEGRIPIKEPTRRFFSTRLQYVDPNLFDSKKLFLVGGISYHTSLYSYRDNNYWESEQMTADMSLGLRVWEFSYFSTGFRYSPNFKISERYTDTNNSTVEAKYDAAQKYYLLTYGWNSEDDPYFPNHGSRFNMIYTWGPNQYSGVEMNASVAYRQTWTTSSGAIMTVKVGGTPGTEYRRTLDEDLGTSFSYARPIAFHDSFGGIEKGRWYLEPGFNGMGYSSYSGTILDPGLKAGLRVETKTLGIVDLYAIASTQWRIGGKK